MGQSQIQSFHGLAERLAVPYRHRATAVVASMMHGESIAVTMFGDPKVTPGCRPEDVLFEIGSITKIFTSLLLARLADDGALDPDRPIGSICVEFAGAPRWITPRSLATHTSGLPRLHVPVWRLLVSGVPDDPYGSFGDDDLVDWMRHWRPAAPPRRQAPVYSNLGVGLLGAVLASSQGRDYDVLLRDLVLAPLGLHDTTITLGADQVERFAAPHSAAGKAVLPWTFKALAGAGAVRSTAGDLARLAGHVIAASNDTGGPLARAIEMTIQPHAGLGGRGDMLPIAQCLGWISMTLRPSGPRMLFHDGGTAGSSSALYVCPEKSAAVIMLANRGVAAGLWSSFKMSLSNANRLVYDTFDRL